MTRWRGVDVFEGDNYFEAIVKDDDGNEVARIEKVYHFSGSPVEVELVEEKSILVSDGKTPPVIAVQLTDKDGFPARFGQIGEFSVDAPHSHYEELRSFDDEMLAKVNNERPDYIVGRDGIARIKLAPTTLTGDVVLRFVFLDEEKELKAWLKPKLREWVLVGFAEETQSSCCW